MRWAYRITIGLLGTWLLALMPVVEAAELPKATLKLYGMTCQICEYALEKNLKRIKEVQKARADLIEGRAEVVFHPGKPIDPVKLNRVVNDSGITLKAVSITAEGLLSRQANQWFFKMGDTDQILQVQQNEKLDRFKGASHPKGVKLLITGDLVIPEKGSEPSLVIEQIHPGMSE